MIWWTTTTAIWSNELLRDRAKTGSHPAVEEAKARSHSRTSSTTNTRPRDGTEPGFPTTNSLTGTKMATWPCWASKTSARRSSFLLKSCCNPRGSSNSGFLRTRSSFCSPSGRKSSSGTASSRCTTSTTSKPAKGFRCNPPTCRRHQEHRRSIKEDRVDHKDLLRLEDDRDDLHRSLWCTLPGLQPVIPSLTSLPTTFTTARRHLRQISLSQLQVRV